MAKVESIFTEREQEIIKQAATAAFLAGTGETTSILSTREQEIIRQAAITAYFAGTLQSEQRTKQVYEDIQRRIKDLPALKRKVEEDKAFLEAHKHEELPTRKSIAGSKAENEHEIEMITKALSTVENDEHFMTIVGKYLENLNDIQISAIMGYGVKSVRYNRKRLLRRIALYLYGKDILNTFPGGTFDEQEGGLTYGIESS